MDRGLCTPSKRPVRLLKVFFDCLEVLHTPMHAWYPTEEDMVCLSFANVSTVNEDIKVTRS